jgi:DNA repair protein RadC
MTEYKEKTTIKNWAEDDRPREKLLLKGKHSLSNAELIAILIGSGSSELSAVDLAKTILISSNNNLIELSKLSVTDLMKFRGIGQAKAISIIAASSRDAFEVFQGILSDSQYEEFWMLLLNKANKIIKKINISEGGISGTVADPKKIFKLALENNASSIILSHNHPSGNIQPSDSDLKLTKKLVDAGKLLDISVLDHVIIGDEKYYSFADENML